jgi:pilus assembly protein Flp/PilA
MFTALLRARRFIGFWGRDMHHLLAIFRDSRGATAIEYGLIATLIAIAAITSMTSVGNKLGKTFNNVSGKLNAS